jgi:hypothetical protein
VLWTAVSPFVPFDAGAFGSCADTVPHINAQSRQRSARAAASERLSPCEFMFSTVCVFVMVVII